jgi:YbgC/YbaW family acyl-CoA thioester hydrolase
MYEYKLTVRGYELDSYGHVNNAVYLNYFEQARWEIFRQLDLTDHFRQNGLLLVVTELQIRYSSEARLFDELIIRTGIKLDAPYLVFDHRMYRHGSRVKVCSVNVKTLLTDKDHIKYDIPAFLLAKLKLA